MAQFKSLNTVTPACNGIAGVLNGTTFPCSTDTNFYTRNKWHGTQPNYKPGGLLLLSKTRLVSSKVYIFYLASFSRFIFTFFSSQYKYDLKLPRR